MADVILTDPNTGETIIATQEGADAFRNLGYTNEERPERVPNPAPGQTPEPAPDEDIAELAEGEHTTAELLVEQHTRAELVEMAEELELHTDGSKQSIAARIVAARASAE